MNQFKEDDGGGRQGDSFEPFAAWWAAEGFVVIPGARLRNVPHPMLGSGWSFDTVGSTDPGWVWNCWNPGGQVHAHDRDGNPKTSWGDPAANVLVVTGPRSRLLVLDCDRHGGADGLASLLTWMDETGIDLPEGPTVRTPSGGLHLLFALDPDEPPVRKPGWLTAVDALGGKGHVPVWPSLRSMPIIDRKTNKTDDVLVEYDFITGSLATLRADLPPAPSALLADIRARQVTVTARDGTVVNGVDGKLPPTDLLMETGLPIGHRRVGAFRLARRLYRLHGDDDEAAVNATLQVVFDRTDADPAVRQEMWRQVDYARRKSHADPPLPKYRPDFTRGNQP